MTAHLWLPAADELTAGGIVSRLGLAGRVRVQHLGNSRAGRPIPLLSVGDGPHSALVVGAPHPNEPTGCLTVLRMLAHLAQKPDFGAAPGWQWHFIPAIDIDGIALNQAWFSDSPQLPRYLEHFYRPPLRLQPEYSFPLDLPAYRFTEETPESACWRRALDIARPHLQCSLHGADTGGAFFIISQEAPRLAAELAKLPTRNDLSLNEVGEPFAELAIYRPGVFAFPAVEEFVARGVNAGAAPGSFWKAGDSSAGFASKRFGTFSMTCEVPLWRDAREQESGPSGRTLADVIDERIHQLRADSAMVAESLPSLRPRIKSFEARALAESLEDSLATGAGVIEASEQARPSGSDDRPLQQCDLAAVESGTYGLRTPAMVVRLAKVTGVSTVEVAARSVLAARLAAHRRATRLTPIGLRQATDLQMAAVLAAAAHERIRRG